MATRAQVSEALAMAGREDIALIAVYGPEARVARDAKKLDGWRFSAILVNLVQAAQLRVRRVLSAEALQNAAARAFV